MCHFISDSETSAKRLLRKRKKRFISVMQLPEMCLSLAEGGCGSVEKKPLVRGSKCFKTVEKSFFYVNYT